MAREGFVIRFLQPFAVAAVLGFLAACGGGTVVPVGGIPPYTGPGAGGTPQASVRVAPAYATALVGTPVTFIAEVSDAPGRVVGYRWARSFDGGKTFVDIAGATDRSYSLGGVTLGDDAAVFRVTLTAVDDNNNVYEKRAFCWLAVAATQGVVFEDGEFLPENWVPPSDGERITSGGNPGAFRQMVGPLPGAVEPFHTYQRAAYDPASEGPIYVIDFEEDCTLIWWSSPSVPQVDSYPLIEQDGRKYVASSPRPWEVYDHCGETTWRKMRRASLGSRDFTLVAGPACNVGQSCPDFSAVGQPMRFGYQRRPSGGQGSVKHGIDNWKVTVWKR
jgi:hypothetical protein